MKLPQTYNWICLYVFMLETRQKNLMQIDMNHEKNLTVVCIEVMSDL